MYVYIYIHHVRFSDRDPVPVEASTAPRNRYMLYVHYDQINDLTTGPNVSANCPSIPQKPYTYCPHICNSYVHKTYIIILQGQT